MKREMKSSILKNIIFVIFIGIFGGCTFLQKQESTLPTIEEVYSSILIDDGYKLNKYLIDGFPLDYEDETGKNLLTIALNNNSLNSIEVLLNKGIETNKKDTFGRTPIFYVKSFEALKKLCKDGVDLNVITNQGDPLIIYFIKNKPLSYSKYIVMQNLDFNLKDENGWSAMFWASVSGDEELINKMDQRGANFLAIDGKGNYPIYYTYDEQNILRLLNIKGYDLKKMNYNGENILGEVYLRAVANGFTSVIEKVLELGVNPYYISYGDSAISIASDNKNKEMIKFLNSNGIK